MVRVVLVLQVGESSSSLVSNYLGGSRHQSFSLIQGGLSQGVASAGAGEPSASSQPNAEQQPASSTELAIANPLLVPLLDPPSDLELAIISTATGHGNEDRFEILMRQSSEEGEYICFFCHVPRTNRIPSVSLASVDCRNPFCIAQPHANFTHRLRVAGPRSGQFVEVASPCPEQ